MLESLGICEQVAEKLVALKERFPVLEVYFKGSFDKANRTALDSPRGPGLEKGLAYLKAVKDRFGLPTTTDVHDTSQVDKVAEVCQVIQIPAFLCRQTDLLKQAGKSGRIVSVKKGQFLSPFQMRFVVEKLKATEAEGIWQIERGFCLGYENLVVDMRNFSILKGFASPVIFDATHSTQALGGATTSGNWEQAISLAKAAVASGADGLFVETHPNPPSALSDRGAQLPLKHLEKLVGACLKIRQVLQEEKNESL